MPVWVRTQQHFIAFLSVLTHPLLEHHGHQRLKVIDAEISGKLF
jgi:hypothetical protein